MLFKHIIIFKYLTMRLVYVLVNFRLNNYFAYFCIDAI